MDVPFCLLCMHNLYMYMYVIHCSNGCTDMFYNCVIFVILNKKEKKRRRNNREKYATISSLNKGCPSSEVSVSRKPKSRTAKTD